jgi:transcriptional regulator with XRE-family HTH domain
MAVLRQFPNDIGPRGTGVRIRRRRLALGLTQAEVAAEAGCASTCVSQIERGYRVRSKFLIDLAVALACDPLWLAGKLGGKAPNHLVAVEAPGVLGNAAAAGLAGDRRAAAAEAKGKPWRRRESAAEAANRIWSGKQPAARVRWRQRVADRQKMRRAGAG